MAAARGEVRRCKSPPRIQGAVAQGVSMVLTGEYFFGADGRMQNSSFLDYRMPTTLDLPMIDTVLVEVPNLGHP
jgi:xanthine dehydrogenase molybdenum-binding subunit